MIFIIFGRYLYIEPGSRIPVSVIFDIVPFAYLLGYGYLFLKSLGVSEYQSLSYKYVTEFLAELRLIIKEPVLFLIMSGKGQQIDIRKLSLVLCRAYI